MFYGSSDVMLSRRRGRIFGRGDCGKIRSPLEGQPTSSGSREQVVHHGEEHNLQTWFMLYRVS